MNNYRNYINGEWLESVSDKTVQNINPANVKDIIGEVKLSTREEARRAVEVAYDCGRRTIAITVCRLRFLQTMPRVSSDSLMKSKPE